MKTELIKDILVSEADGRTIVVSGWVRTKRESKNLVFLQVNDGSCFASLQLTFDRENPNFTQGANSQDSLNQLEANLKSLTTGASLRATGKLVPSPASGQAVELQLEQEELAAVLEKYPVCQMESLPTSRYLLPPRLLLDIGAKQLVLETLVRLNREQKLTIVIVSSELQELRSICDRIAIVSEGRINCILRPDSSDASFGLAMSGAKVNGGDLA